ncbi:MAG: phytanoyl-CoA dioxygenase family protein [Alphaproteobacteria bacterium]|nr:phytanoyl-CoA dioxygenase family protein [Alphaproteobacteria bacterium]
MTIPVLETPSLARDGFCIFRGAVDAETVSELLAESHRLRADAVAGNATPVEVLRVPGTGPEGPIRALRNVTRGSAHFAKAVADQIMARPLAPPEVPLHWVGVQSLFWKRPGDESATIGWHRDTWFRADQAWVAERSPTYFHCALILEPMSPETGSIRLVRGSHLVGLVERQGGSVMVTAAEPDDVRAYGLDPAAVVAVRLAPGDLLCWSVETFHASGPNLHGPGERTQFVTGWVVNGTSPVPDLVIA